MTDKQIIIHGEQVPVITLTRQQIEEDWYTLHQALKAKEQECEGLNEELCYWVNGEYCDNECNVVKAFDQLKIESENWKNLCKFADKQIDKLKTERDDYIDKYFLESQKVVKLSKALTEIKEIAKPYKKQRYDDVVVSSLLEKMKKIAEISEVEDETSKT